VLSFLLSFSSNLPVFGFRSPSFSLSHPLSKALVLSVVHAFSFSGPFSLSLASSVVPQRSFVNSPCLWYPLSFFLSVSSIISVIIFRFPCVLLFLQFSQSLVSAAVVVLPCWFVNSLSLVSFCLWLPLSFLNVLSSILPVFGFRCPLFFL
jgi:hypothetical protein